MSLSDYVKENVDEIMDLFIQLHTGMSRQSKSQHRKAMLRDYTTLTYKPVVKLYWQKKSEEDFLVQNAERCKELYDRIDDLERDAIKWKRDEARLQKKVADLEGRIESDFHGMRTLNKVLSRMFNKAEVFKINTEFHDECGHQLGLKSNSAE